MEVGKVDKGVDHSLIPPALFVPPSLKWWLSGPQARTNYIVDRRGPGNLDRARVFFFFLPLTF
jgi:hypothetical protein